MLVRAARAADNRQIAAIWNHEALATASTTDTEPRTPEAQRAWLRAHGAEYPVVIAAEGDEVLAFGALAPYRTKPSYRRTVDRQPRRQIIRGLDGAKSNRRFRALAHSDATRFT